MLNPNYCRQRAEECREIASASRDPAEIQQLTLLAVEFDVQAVALDLHAAALNEAAEAEAAQPSDESLGAAAGPYPELQPRLPRCSFLFGRDHSDIEQSFHAGIED